MHRRTTGRIAGTAAVLALAGGGVAYAASSGTTTEPTTTPAPSTTQTQPQRPSAPPGGWRGRGGPVAPGAPGGAGVRGLPGGHGFGPLLGLGAPRELTRTAAAYLGLSADELDSRLRDGRSLAEVARAEGKSVDGLQEAVVAAAKTRLDAAVADGWLGAKMRDRIVAELKDHVDELVAATPPAGRPLPPRLRDGSGDCRPRSGRGD